MDNHTLDFYINRKKFTAEPYNNLPDELYILGGLSGKSIVVFKLLTDVFFVDLAVDLKMTPEYSSYPEFLY